MVAFGVENVAVKWMLNCPHWFPYNLLERQFPLTKFIRAMKEPQKWDKNANSRWGIIIGKIIIDRKHVNENKDYNNVAFSVVELFPILDSLFLDT